MKAIVCTKYGSVAVLELQEIKKPTPKDNQVLIKIEATTVTAGDCEIRRLDFGLFFSLLLRIFIRFKTLVLGMEIAGEVVAVGKDVTRFKTGDQVFAANSFGGNAQYICIAENERVALKPINMTPAEAAAVPVGATSALHFLRKANIEPGTKVLIHGASGSIGTFAVQIAKHFGAEVTGVCSMTNLALVKSLGADNVIDYTKEDYTKGEAVYDVILDTLGKTSVLQCAKLLKVNGRYLLASPRLRQWLSGLWMSMTSSKKVIFSTAEMSTEELTFLKGLIEAGAVKSVIDRSYSLQDIQQAHVYVDKGHKKGNVVIMVGHD